MSEYARPTNNLPAVLNPVICFRVSTIALAAVAVLGFVANITANDKAGYGFLSFEGGFLPFTYTHDIVHLVLACAAFLFGFANLPGNTVKVFAIIFGAVYTALGIVGFFAFQAAAAGGDTFLGLSLPLNIVHILLGGYALAAGFLAKFD
ncbi:MAG: hypothetical protein QOD77_479 [Thermoplasmata archaeon]|jgi:hypothetical protein|nr:hypothetical protein [Thermoplasmata archaeon]